MTMQRKSHQRAAEDNIKKLAGGLYIGKFAFALVAVAQSLLAIAEQIAELRKEIASGNELSGHEIYKVVE